MTVFNLLRASRDPLSHAVRFYVAKETRYTRLADRQVLTEEGVQDYTPRIGEDVGPSFTAVEDAAQVLFEDLWAAGFRSKNDRDAGDRVDAARREHIADLRKFAKLG